MDKSGAEFELRTASVLPRERLFHCFVVRPAALLHGLVLPAQLLEKLHGSPAPVGGGQHRLQGHGRDLGPAEALKQGIRKDRKDVAGYLDVFKRQLQDAQTSEAYFLSAIQKMSKPDRFVAQYQEVSNIQDKNISEDGYYYIFDKKEQHIVTDEKGNPQTYKSAIEALKAATELEQAFKAQEKQQREAQQKHTVPVNIPEDVTPKM